MDISRRGFLRKLAEVTGIGTGALLASKLPKLPEVAPEPKPMSVQESAVQEMLISQGGCITSSFDWHPATGATSINGKNVPIGE